MTDPSRWHPAALSQDLVPATVIPARCGPHEIALWRSETGALRAWQDRCPHRGMRLSHGFVRGEMLSCIYHGWRYDGEAVCRKIPAHPALEPPSSITVPRFRVAEAGGVIWIASDPGNSAPPEMAEGLRPLRSVPVDRSAAGLRDALGHDVPARLEDGLCVLVQEIDETRSVLHALTSGNVEPKIASRRLESLRRRFEKEPAA